MTHEIWLPVPGVPGYEVSNRGRVRSLPRTIKATNRSRFKVAGRIVKQATLKKGYMQVMLGRGINRYVHELVLLAFRGSRPGFCTASHINGVRSDNRIENLTWESHRDNCARKVEHGTQAKGEGIASAKLTEEDVRAIRSTPRSGWRFFTNLAKQYRVSPKAIRAVYNRHSWKHV